MSDTDFIVLDLDGGPWLDDCLASILGQSERPGRVLLFDNGSIVPTSQRISRPDAIELIRSEQNLGFAGGVNAALRASRAGFVALINSDVVLDRDWLATLLPAMADQRVAAVQTILRAADGQTIDGAGIDIADGTIRQAMHGAAAGTPPLKLWGVSATAALYRRSAIGDEMFDARFFAYYEDVELCARLHRDGWLTLTVPSTCASHAGSSSASRIGSQARYLRTRNRYFVARLHTGVGKVSALLREDARLLMRGQSSIRGIIAGLCSPLS